MMLIEVAHPPETLTEEDRTVLARHVVDVLLSVEHAPEETMRKGRAMTHVRFHESTTWHTGDGVVDIGTGTAPPLIVTITVPEQWEDEVARHMIGTVRAAVRRVDSTRGWHRLDGHLWVNVVGVRDGNIGLNGKSSTADDVLAHMTADYRTAHQAGQARPIPEGMLVDPVCGMLVTPGKGAITIEHDGVTWGFCAAACRDAFRP